MTALGWLLWLVGCPDPPEKDTDPTEVPDTGTPPPPPDPDVLATFDPSEDGVLLGGFQELSWLSTLYNLPMWGCGDLNADGAGDIVLVSDEGEGGEGAWSWYAGPFLSDRGGVADGSVRWDHGFAPLVVADLNADNAADLLVLVEDFDGGPDEIRVWWGGTDDFLDSARTDAILVDPNRNIGDDQLSTVDLDADGLLEVATTYPEWRVFRSDQTDQSPDDAVLSFADGIYDRVFGDVNGDGVADMVVGVETADARMGVYYGPLMGQTLRYGDADTSLEGFGWDLAIADVNGDGGQDVLTHNFDYDTPDHINRLVAWLDPTRDTTEDDAHLAVILGVGPESVGLDDYPEARPVVMDWNGDAAVDLIVSVGDTSYNLLFGPIQEGTWYREDLLRIEFENTRDLMLAGEVTGDTLDDLLFTDGYHVAILPGQDFGLP